MGETRPLTDGGYYRYWFYRPLPGSNQFTEYYLELVVETTGNPPTEHIAQLHYCNEDDTSVHRIELLERESVSVAFPDDDGSQKDTEQRILSRAVEIMRQYNDWDAPYFE